MKYILKLLNSATMLHQLIGIAVTTMSRTFKVQILKGKTSQIVHRRFSLANILFSFSECGEKEY